MKKTSRKLRKFLSFALDQALGVLADVGDRITPVFNAPLSRRFRRFAKRYSAQLSFTFFILMFLTLSVGEGQAYAPGTFANNYVDEQVKAHAEGFVGKPQVFGGQTILTGEVQKLVAISYTVEQGDSLVSVAKRYNISVGSIIDANNLKISEIEKIKPGTELLIPAEDTDTSLAWLDSINKLKQQEEQARQQAEQQRLARARTTAPSRTTTRVSSYGDYTIVGRFYNLPTRGAVPGQCTNWVKYKRPDLPARMGNGGQYLAYARSYGIPTSYTPQAGAVVVTTDSRVYGHVAYVESVGNGFINVSEMNYVAPFVVSRRSIPINSPTIRGYVLR